MSCLEGPERDISYNASSDDARTTHQGDASSPTPSCTLPATDHIASCTLPLIVPPAPCALETMSPDTPCCLHGVAPVEPPAFYPVVHDDFDPPSNTLEATEVATCAKEPQQRQVAVDIDGDCIITDDEFSMPQAVLFEQKGVDEHTKPSTSTPATCIDIRVAGKPISDAIATLAEHVCLPPTCTRAPHPMLQIPAVKAAETMIYQACMVQYLTSRFALQEHWSSALADECALYRLLTMFELPPIYRRAIRPQDPKHSAALTLGLVQGLRDDPFISFPSIEYREVVAYVCRSLQQKFGAVSFTGIYIGENCLADVHVDEHNRGMAYHISLGPVAGGHLWELTSDGTDLQPLPHGTWNLLSESSVHAGTPYVGHRLSVIAFTSKALYSSKAKKLLPQLVEHGFPVPADCERVVQFPSTKKQNNRRIDHARKLYAEQCESLMSSSTTARVSHQVTVQAPRGGLAVWLLSMLFFVLGIQPGSTSLVVHVETSYASQSSNPHESERRPSEGTVEPSLTCSTIGWKEWTLTDDCPNGAGRRQAAQCQTSRLPPPTLFTKLKKTFAHCPIRTPSARRTGSSAPRKNWLRHLWPSRDKVASFGQCTRRLRGHTYAYAYCFTVASRYPDEALSTARCPLRHMSVRRTGSSATRKNLPSHLPKAS